MSWVGLNFKKPKLFAVMSLHKHKDSWLRRRATSRKVAGSIPDSVIGIFFDLILPSEQRPLGRFNL